MQIFVPFSLTVLWVVLSAAPAFDRVESTSVLGIVASALAKGFASTFPVAKHINKIPVAEQILSAAWLFQRIFTKKENKSKNKNND